MDGGGSGGSEDDRVERCRGEGGLVGHETLGDGVLHTQRVSSCAVRYTCGFDIRTTGWKTISSATPAGGISIDRVRVHGDAMGLT